MKTLRTLLLLLALGAVTTVNAQQAALEFDNADAALKVVQGYVTALKAGDVAAMNAALADGAMVYGLGNGMDSLTAAQHQQYFTGSFSTFEHSITGELYLPVKVTDSWNAGEWVLAWGTNTLTHKKTGNKSTVPYHSASLVKDGKIIGLYYYYDVLNILQTQGYTITAPGE
ncbi:MAG: nuclear transport factor 2 family protein [Cyclobacteriaceae bacterium]